MMQGIMPVRKSSVDRGGVEIESASPTVNKERVFSRGQPWLSETEKYILLNHCGVCFNL